MGMRNFAIGLAIAVILPCVVYYGLMTFSPAAKYGECSKEEYLESVGLKDVKNPADKVKAAAAGEEYDKGSEAFAKHLFYVAMPVGILLIAAGLAMPIPGIGSGFMFGGLFTLFYGFFAYWSGLSALFRFVSLLFGLILFVIIGWNKYKKKAV